MAFLMKECFWLRTSPAASCADLPGNSLQFVLQIKRGLFGNDAFTLNTLVNVQFDCGCVYSVRTSAVLHPELSPSGSGQQLSG